MDAFVIRTPRSISKSNHSASNSKSKVKKGGQRRLNDLRGVVVLEDIQAFVTQLKSSQVASGEKVEILKNLLSKQPSTEVIVKTGIGKVVKKLMLKSEDPELAKAARQVKIRWQNLIERRIDLKTGEKPEVISDLQTRTTREKALTLLNQRYSHVISEETLERLEKAIYNHFRPVIGDKYRRSVRKIALHRSKFQQHLENKDFDLVVKQVTTGEK